MRQKQKKVSYRESAPKTQNQENYPPTIGNGRVYPESRQKF